MNSTPVLQGRPVQPSSCGRQAVSNTMLASWLSTMTKHGQAARFQDVTDISALARSVRKGWRQ